MGKNNLNLGSMNNFIAGGELKLIELNQSAMKAMNDPFGKWQGKAKKRQVKKHKKHAHTEGNHEEKVEKALEVASEKPLNRRAEAIRQMHEHEVVERVVVERTYLQEAIILSEILGQPVCKRRNRRRSRNI